MDIKSSKTERIVSAKKSYQAPTLKDWGTLKDITLANNSGGKNDSGRKPFTQTH
jgi:hypothetical protein